MHVLEFVYVHHQHAETEINVWPSLFALNNTIIHVSHVFIKRRGGGGGSVQIRHKKYTTETSITYNFIRAAAAAVCAHEHERELQAIIRILCAIINSFVCKCVYARDARLLAIE